MSAPKWEIRQARFVAGAVHPSHYPAPPRPQVAFAGRSNVGKSSVLNSLTRVRGLARVSRTPGLTQQINFFLINDEIYFVDLPGYGFAHVPPAIHRTWQRMVEAYLTRNASLRLVVLLLDARREPSPLDDLMVDYLRHQSVAFVPVLTKCDKLGKNALAKAQETVRRHYALQPANPPLLISAHNGTGRETLLQTIHSAAHGL